jgi:hypothetical protein
LSKRITIKDKQDEVRKYALKLIVSSDVLWYDFCGRNKLPPVKAKSSKSSIDSFTNFIIDNVKKWKNYPHV